MIYGMRGFLQGPTAGFRSEVLQVVELSAAVASCDLMLVDAFAPTGNMRTYLISMHIIQVSHNGFPLYLGTC